MQELRHNDKLVQNYDGVIEDLRKSIDVTGVQVIVREESDFVVMQVGDDQPLNMTVKQARDLALTLRKSANSIDRQVLGNLQKGKKRSRGRR